MAAGVKWGDRRKGWAGLRPTLGHAIEKVFF